MGTKRYDYDIDDIVAMYKSGAFCSEIAAKYTDATIVVDNKTGAGGLIAAEAEIIAHEKLLHAQFVLEHAAAEGLGALFGKLAGERHEEHGVHAQPFQNLKALLARTEELGRIFGEDGGRVRIEGNDHGGQLLTVGTVHSTAEKLLMAEVHAVEVPYRGHTGRPPCHAAEFFDIGSNDHTVI